jgi:hypothetical protein
LKTNKVKQKKYKYARYPNVLTGEYNFRQLVEIAQKNGMKIIIAYKPVMHVCAEIGLYGTPVQMRKTDEEWKAGGTKLISSRWSGIIGVPLNIPRTKWVNS